MAPARVEPAWDLALVQEVASGGGRSVVLKKTRALDSFASPAEAYRTTKKVLAQLSLDSFSETVTLRFDMKADVYGVVIGGAGWILKLTVDESVPQVVVISLHPLEKGPLRTRGGMVNP